MLKCIYSNVPLIKTNSCQTSQFSVTKTANFRSQNQPIFSHKTSQFSGTKTANFKLLVHKQTIFSHKNSQFSVTKTANFYACGSRHLTPLFKHLSHLSLEWNYTVF